MGVVGVVTLKPNPLIFEDIGLGLDEYEFDDSEITE
jgi:hypothetical protein